MADGPATLVALMLELQGHRSIHARQANRLIPVSRAANLERVILHLQ